MLYAFIQAMVPIFLLAGLGALLSRKTNWLDNPSLGALVTNIGLPALLLHSILKMDMALAGMAQLLLAMVATLAGVALLTWLFLRLIGRPVRYYLPVLTNPNTGNLGIPVVYALLGEQALAAAVVLSSVVTISHFTLGVAVMSGRLSLGQLSRNAPGLALLVGALLLALQIELPEFAMHSLDLLGGITLPIMLLLLGRSLSHLRLSSAIDWRFLAAMALYRPVAGASVGFVIASLFQLPQMDALTLIIQAAMPTAVISYILTTRYQGPVDEVAALIVLSLPTSLLTVALLNAVFNPI